MASFLHLCNRCSAVVRFPTKERPEKVYCDACKEALPGDGVFQTEQAAAKVAEKNKTLEAKRAETEKAAALAQRATEKAARSNAARLKEQKEAAAKPRKAVARRR
ncbi:MAG: hypothetical protein IID41_15170 [Planctomycetes bacterium]|nr:hypothetical protein [Planctomycetota bacterium]